MSSVGRAILSFLGSFFRTRAALQLEILALRHQLAVAQRSVAHPRLRPADRIFWAWLSRIWSGWKRVLQIVQTTPVHLSRVHQLLDVDCPEHRPVEPPELDMVVEIAQVGGLHRRYERQAA